VERTHLLLGLAVLAVAAILIVLIVNQDPQGGLSQISARIVGLNDNANRDVLYQTSTFTALLRGLYDGDFTFGELKKKGDFGIGTFNGLDGEMVELDGVVYQIKSDGTAYIADNSMKTPFSTVTFFDSDSSTLLDRELDDTQLSQYLDGLLPSKNIFYAIKIDGVFSRVKTRSVPKQDKPYQPLLEVVKNQPTFEFSNVSGTIVGFWSPEYVTGLNVPGYHLHFITRDLKSGGHVLEYEPVDVSIQIDYTTEFDMVLPQNSDFYGVELVEQVGETDKVEK